MEYLAGHLREKKLLIILDNFEHLLAAGSLIVRKNHAVRGTQSRHSTVVLCSICYQLIN